MVSILQDECAKPGLRSWVGINTEIQIKKVNATQRIGGWRCSFKNAFLHNHDTKSMVFASSLAQVYHGWRAMYDKIGVTLEGGLLEDASANHVFMAMQLQGPFDLAVISSFILWKLVCCILFD